jgi:hypothetical protein
LEKRIARVRGRPREKASGLELKFELEFARGSG